MLYSDQHGFKQAYLVKRLSNLLEMQTLLSAKKQGIYITDF